jgi:quercetin dioxygenase-like cupin family protein
MIEPLAPQRRVITGLDAEGRSTLLIDGPSRTVIWSSAETPVDNSRTGDAGGIPFRIPTHGNLFIYSDFPPGDRKPMHSTDTIDYIIVLSGEVVFIAETAQTRLRAGDVIVCRGITHGWHNDTDMPCRILSVLCPSLPVGLGGTVSGVPGG